MTKETTTEDLARMIKGGFDNTATKGELEEVKRDIKKLEIKMDEGFEKVDERFEILETKVDVGFSHANTRLGMIEGDISEIKKNFISREAFEDLMGRVKYLELKLGVESGK